MIEQLKKVLEEGVKTALQSQAEHTNQSFILQGKGAAFKEVLAVIQVLEKNNGEDITAEKKEEDQK